MDLMRELNRSKGLTLVIVTHDPVVGAQCDRIVRMRDGQIDHDAESMEESIAAD
jgi:putative ABC transport system ATP-binding protein